MRGFRSHNLRFFLTVLVILEGFLETAKGPGMAAACRILALAALPALSFLDGAEARERRGRAALRLALYPAAQVGYYAVANLFLPAGSVAASLLHPYRLNWYLPVSAALLLTARGLARVRGRLRLPVWLLCAALSVGAGFWKTDILGAARYFALLPFFAGGFFAHDAQKGGVPSRPLGLLWGVLAAAASGAALYGGPLPGQLSALAAALGWIGFLLAWTPDRYIPAVTESGCAYLPALLLHPVPVLLLQAQGVDVSSPPAILCLAAASLILALFLSIPTRDQDRTWDDFRRGRRETHEREGSP